MSSHVGSLPVERVLRDGTRVRWLDDSPAPRRSKWHLIWIVATLLALGALALPSSGAGQATVPFDTGQAERVGPPEGIR